MTHVVFRLDLESLFLILYRYLCQTRPIAVGPYYSYPLLHLRSPTVPMSEPQCDDPSTDVGLVASGTNGGSGDTAQGSVGGVADDVGVQVSDLIRAEFIKK